LPLEYHLPEKYPHLEKSDILTEILNIFTTKFKIDYNVALKMMKDMEERNDRNQLADYLEKMGGPLPVEEYLK